jgi:hypothetical protein
VIIEQTGLNDLVYNDFYVGEDCDVVIVAGCGISNCGGKESRHDGIHSFHVGKNSKVKYIEKHYGEGTGTGGRVMNPTTIVELEENAYMEMETTQIRGINDTLRKTSGKLARRRVPGHPREDNDHRRAEGGDRLLRGSGRRGQQRQRGVPLRGQGQIHPGASAP